MSSCFTALGERNSSCVGFEHKYCLKRTELCGECLCQRWVRVDYNGKLVIAPHEWKRFIAEKLQGIKCEFFGYEVLDGGGLKPKWIFFIYLCKPASREDVFHLFSSVDFSADVQRLGQSLLHDCADDDLYPSFLSCCYDQFFELTVSCSHENTCSFASDGIFLTALLTNELESCDSFYTLLNVDHLSPIYKRILLC